jgi:hypothetical protein
LARDLIFEFFPEGGPRVRILPLIEVEKLSRNAQAVAILFAMRRERLSFVARRPCQFEAPLIEFATDSSLEGDGFEPSVRVYGELGALGRVRREPIEFEAL